MAKTFKLDKRLEADTLHVADLALNTVRLMNDSRFLWLIAVPRLTDLVEIIDLPEGGRRRLWTEIDRLAEVVKAARSGCKLNIGALGNMVSQLHIHVIARSPDDAAWPGPVWGQGQATPYLDDEREQLISNIREMLSLPASGR